MPITRSIKKFMIMIPMGLLIYGCSSTKSDESDNHHPPMDALVSTEWLSEHLDDPDLVVLDCTTLVKMDESGKIVNLSGRTEYEAAHIPGAGFADLKADLRDASSPLDFAMPSVSQFSAAMGALGVSNNSRVVLYDTGYTVWAARVWWMLRWAGFDRVALLDGGLKAWKDEGRPISSEPVNRLAKTFKVNPRPELIADRDEVFDAIASNETDIFDAMPEAHYRGEFAMYSRPGHIPGAMSLSSSNMLDEGGHMRSFDELDMMHEGDRDGRAITYCGGGVAASLVAYNMNRIGFSDVAVYMGSLQEWTADPGNPMSMQSE